MRWQALPPFVSRLANLTAFDVRNGAIIIPQGNVPRPGFLETINTASYTAQGCTPVVSSLPCAQVEYANTLGLGPGLRIRRRAACSISRRFQPWPMDRRRHERARWGTVALGFSW